MANSLVVNVLDLDTGSAIGGASVAILTVSGDTSVDSDVTDALGGVTLTGLSEATPYYLTASADGYDSITKSAQYEGGRVAWQYDTAGEDSEMTITLSVTRGRTAIVVMEGTGLSAAAPFEPVSGATVSVKNASGDAEIESLTTDAHGVALMDDSLYTGITAIYAVVSKTGYTSKTRHLGTSSLGDILPVTLVPTPDITTYTLSGYIVDTAGNPLSGEVLQVEVLGAKSHTVSGSEYYSKPTAALQATTDEDGKFEFTIASGLIVKPANWATYGLSNARYFVMDSDIELGDGTIGSI